jgi:hypothetical protein
MKLDELLEKFAVAVATDNPFQRRARLLQSMWREAKGLPMGERRAGVPLGSRLPLELAKVEQANFLTANIRRLVRECIEAKAAGSGQLIEEDRLYANLLSSQPLCFNLFGELQSDLGLASAVCARLWPDRVRAVTGISFEHSPGRSDIAYTGDRSAFDVFIEHSLPEREGRGFIGIEVKYHENLKVAAAGHRPRYNEIASAMGCFVEEKLPALRAAPLEQIWRDHLLAGAMLASGEWASGLYVFLYPEGNTQCARGVASYLDCLEKRETFAAVTLERLVEELERQTDAPWVSELRDRYLGWDRIDTLLNTG